MTMEPPAVPVTDSAEYAIRYGGVWLEFHERVAFAEEQLKIAHEERVAVQKERDDLLLANASLEDKFKSSIESLTHTESNHLEARQIVEQVREEHKDLSRRCLAAEAHTEWLEDQLKQQKALRLLKDEEISSLQFRIENLKSSQTETDSANQTLKDLVATRDNEIVRLKAALKSRDEEVVIMGRSNHTKDKQLAQVVRERNALKDDLEATQRSLALAGRSGTSVRKLETAMNHNVDIENKKAFDGVHQQNVQMNKRGGRDATRSNESVREPVVNAPTTDKSASRGVNSNGTSSAEAVLRKYKQSRMHTRRAASLCGASTVATETWGPTGGLMLDDILESVLTTETLISADEDAHMENSTSMDVSSDAMAVQLSNLPSASFTTPVAATRKGKPAVAVAVGQPALAHSDIPQQLQDGSITASLLLDDCDLNFIDDILESITPGGFSSPPPARAASSCTANTSPKRIPRSLASTSLSSANFDATVHKMLFGGDSPRQVKCANPWGGGEPAAPAVTPMKKCENKDTVESDVTTPLTAVGRSMAPDSTDTAGSSETTDDAFPSTPQDVNNMHNVRSCGASNCSASSTPCNTAQQHQQQAATEDITPYVEREQTYKSALYLLQEEVRMLRAQVAAHDAAKRIIRTPSSKKSATKNGSTNSAATPTAAITGACCRTKGNGTRKFSAGSVLPKNQVAD